MTRWVGRFAFLFLAFCLGAGEPLERARPAMRVFGYQEGLPTLTLNGLALDRLGRLWVAGREGPARFNGRSWTAFELPARGTSPTLRAVLETSDGALWFGTQDAGLWRLEAGRWTSFHPGNGFPHHRVNTLLQTRDHLLWAGTGGGGLARFEKGAWQKEEGFPTSWVWKLYEGEDGTLWAGTQKGLYRRQDGRWKLLPGLPGQEVNDLLEVPDATGTKVLWVCIWGQGMAAWDGKRWSLESRAEGFPSTLPTSLVSTGDLSGERILWVGTYDAGLAFRKDGGWHVLDQAAGFPAEGVYSLLPDPQSRAGLWAGTRGQGLVHIEPGAWWTLDARAGLPSSEITALTETISPKGPTLWLGTNRGLARLEGESNPWPHPELKGQFVNALAEFQGELWAGTPVGLFRRHRGNWERFDESRGLPNNHIRSLLNGEADGRPALWVGTTLGVGMLRDGKWTHFGNDVGITHPWLGALAQTRDPDGGRSVWIGTWGGGVSRLRHGTWSHYRTESGLPNLSVNALLVQDGSGPRAWLWAATLGGGLARLDLSDSKEHWEVLSQATHPSLGSDSVRRLEWDRAGRLYARTAQAVVRITLSPDGRLDRATVEPFTPGDGVPTLASSLGPSLVDHQGRVWFGTPAGAAVLDPRVEVPLPDRPTLVWESLRQGARECSPALPGTFGHRENHFRFEFLQPRLYRQDEIRYRTQLLGLDREPGPWTPEAFRDFPALPRGTYTFQVWARDVQGRETGPLAWSFTVRPAPWLHPAALLAYVLTGLCTAGLAVRWRTRVLQARTHLLEARIHEATRELQDREQTLARLNQELWQANEAKNQFLGIAAHDLKSPLSAILPSSELLAQGGLEEEVQNMGRSIFNSARQMVRLVTRLLELDALERGRLVMESTPVNPAEVVGQAESTFQRLASAKGIQIKVEGPPYLLLIRADIVHLQQVIDNLVSNSIKFTPPAPPGREVFIRFRREGGEGVLEVQDQGPGFTEADLGRAFGEFARLSAQPTGGETSTGLGLSITKRLVEAMDGRLELESRPGHGATFRVRLPLA